MQIYKLLQKIMKQKNKMFPHKRELFARLHSFRKGNVSSLL